MPINKINREHNLQGIEYTCPMHPEIRQIGPSNCPICGMSLEPVSVVGDEEENSEYKYMHRRFLISAILSSPLLLFVTMGGRHLIHNQGLLEQLK